MILLISSRYTTTDAIERMSPREAAKKIADGLMYSDKMPARIG